jgi:hypothetical protein
MAPRTGWPGHQGTAPSNHHPAIGTRQHSATPCRIAAHHSLWPAGCASWRCCEAGSARRAAPPSCQDSCAPADAAPAAPSCAACGTRASWPGLTAPSPQRAAAGASSLGTAGARSICVQGRLGEGRVEVERERECRVACLDGGGEWVVQHRGEMGRQHFLPQQLARHDGSAAAGLSWLCAKTADGQITIVLCVVYRVEV